MSENQAQSLDGVCCIPRAYLWSPSSMFHGSYVGHKRSNTNPKPLNIELGKVGMTSWHPGPHNMYRLSWQTHTYLTYTKLVPRPDSLARLTVELSQ